MKVAWLIEVGESPVLYFAEDGDWCSNPNHAHQFSSAAEAQNKAATMETMCQTRVVEHSWN